MLNPNDIPDHPIVRNMMLTGFPDGLEPKSYICPRCGQECYEYYVAENEKVVGCEKCITMYYAEDWEEDFT